MKKLVTILLSLSSFVWADSIKCETVPHPKAKAKAFEDTANRLAGNDNNIKDMSVTHATVGKIICVTIED